MTSLFHEHELYMHKSPSLTSTCLRCSCFSISITSEEVKAIPRYGFLLLLTLILHRARSTQRTMVEKMAIYSKAALKRSYLDHIMMQFPQGNDYPADTSRVHSVTLEASNQSCNNIPAQAAVISSLSVRSRTLGVERR